MRRHARRLARSVTLAYALSVFVPFLLCGAGPVTKTESSACCRAMQFKCHKAHGDGPCCKHQSVAPVQSAIASASQVPPLQPLATVGVLPIAVTGGLLGRQFCHRLFDLSPAHAPPGNVPLFLFHSTLLI